MARLKDENKRDAIIQTAKLLFSQKGFYNTSISDIVKETGLPVGSIYTYFSSKDKIVQAIVEEGWASLEKRLEKMMQTAAGAQEKLNVLLEHFMPELFEDLDLITILLSEALHYTKIETKIEKLTSIISSIVEQIADQKGEKHIYKRKTLETGLMVFFLGILNAVKISRSSSVDITVRDIRNFLRETVENTLGITLTET